jgi:hypothetical protein
MNQNEKDMITYNFFGEDFIIEEYSGDVNEQEFALLKRDEIDRTDYGKIQGIVMDLRKAKFKFGKKGFEKLMAFLIKNKDILRNKSIAILTKTMEQLNFGYLFMDHLNEHLSPIKIEHFSTKKEAYRWLKTQ